MMDTEHRLTQVEERSKSNSHRIDELETAQRNLNDLTASVASLATKQGDMDTDIKEIKSDVKTLAGKPAKRWEDAVDRVLWAVLAAVAAFVLAHLGL